MGLSSNCLFHYTDSLDTIQKIISGGFSPSYCDEQVVAVPMISFCDIPLTQALQHLDYGRYAIGMNRAWVKRNKLNPVLYIDRDSEVRDLLSDGLKSTNEVLEYFNGKKEPEILEPLKAALLSSQAVMETFRYRKFYEGDLTRKDGTTKNNHRFYDEREWRYVPKMGSEDFQDYIPIAEYDDFKAEHPEKPHLPQIKLSMTAKDIDYIIVSETEDVPKLMAFLDEQGSIGSPNDIRLLYTRILTIEQITRDF